MACFEVVNLICIKLYGFQDQRIEFQFKCMGFLLLEKTKYLTGKQIKTSCVFFLCHLRKLQNSIAMHSKLCDVVYAGKKLWCIDFFKGTSTVLSLSQSTVIFWLFSLQLLVERLFIIVEFQYDCKLNDAKHNELKYTKDQLMCYLSKYIEE